MLHINDKREEWGDSTSWIRGRCRDGMVIGAYKDKGRWVIPFDAERPPCTFNEMCRCLHLILDASKGNDVKLFPDKGRAKRISIYRFLSDNGYISRLPRVIDEKALKKAKVLSLGDVALAKYDLVMSSPKEKERVLGLGTEKAGYTETSRSKEL